MLPAGPSELRKAFLAHVHVHAQLTSESLGKMCRSLLVFYAAESGLKAVFLRRNSLRTTEQFPDDLKGDGHNLWLLAKKLRIPASASRRVEPQFRLHRDRSRLHSDRHPIAEAHQAWRYGIGLHSDDEQSLLDWMRGLCNWVKQGGEL